MVAAFWTRWRTAMRASTIQSEYDKNLNNR
jgi:hypothetical protein